MSQTSRYIPYLCIGGSGRWACWAAQHSAQHTHFRIRNSRALLPSCCCASDLIGQKSSSRSRPIGRAILLAQITHTRARVPKRYVNTIQNTKNEKGVDRGAPAPLQYDLWAVYITWPLWPFLVSFPLYAITVLSPKSHSSPCDKIQ